ncbi:DUF427 domain-containing protein [Kitasatospora sp. GP82]|uniref:DUF427 domain-containing protein n=1 Tax=Kitasatospora sp. GP82 TaxID=3035089 RepID=UPI0024742A8F|nr:DUF427 domain-containing protein [Kitasatospora sp. GP82]MDH6125754.1 uncharacterized protein (DUF427 family) [Kitasatospora sp. GP82]
MAIARWNDEILAESSETTVVEGNHYFPLASVRTAFLTPSPTTTVCPWKGTASYYTVQVAGAENPDAAWYYADPSPAAAQIAGHVAFWRGVEVTDD